MKFLKLGLLFLLISSCQTTGYFINDSPLQASDIRVAVSAVIGTPRMVSLNGRELYSVYHDEKFVPYESLDESQTKKDYYYTKVVILGTKRPFEVQVTVLREGWDNDLGKIVNKGEREDLSLKRAVSIRKALNISRDKSQGFDVSKPF